MGGLPLLSNGYRTATLIGATQVPDLAKALASITQDWFRKRFFALPDNQLYAIDEESYLWAWEEFLALPEFFAEAAKARHAVVSTISH